MKRIILALTVATLAVAAVPTGGGAQPANRPTAAFVAGELLVKYRDTADASAQDRARGRVNATAAEKVRGRANGLSDVELLRIPPGLEVAAAIGAISADPAVEYAEPNYIYTHDATSNDPAFTGGQLWGMYGPSTSPSNQYGSNAAAAWAAGQTGSNTVYIGVIDEGFQPNHVDLADNVWSNPFDPIDGVDNDGNGYADDVNGWDFDGNNNTVYDGGTRGRLDTHGTHVAGTIGGVGGNGIGVAGVVWDVQLISAKFLGQRGGTTANAIRAVDYFTDLKLRHGLNIVATNNSWGGGGFSQALYDAIKRGGDAGILFVAAAGNATNNNDASASYPASYNLAVIISVAALTNTGGLASYSNYGATSVDIGAPGSGIYSTLPFNKYGTYSGTSMATPHVAGAVALYAAANPGATATQIKNAILSSAVPTASLSGKTLTGGRLDAFAALSR